MFKLLLFPCLVLSNVIVEDLVMTEIKRHFGSKRLQYACVAQEITDMMDDSLFLNIQIILKEKVNKKTWFLDKITGRLSSHKIISRCHNHINICLKNELLGTHCNYQVTSNDRAWNAFIKKG